MPIRIQSRYARRLPKHLRIGFTLIELLVVIVIIALLLALMMPALRKSISKANTAKSLSNLRQIQAALVTYATENDGNYPYANGTTAAPNGTYWNEVVKSRFCPNATSFVGTVLRSPNVEKNIPTNIISYGYNGNFTYVAGESSKWNLIYKAATTVMLADNYGSNQTLLTASGGDKLNARNGASQDFANNGQAVAVFLDGHAEIITANRTTILNGNLTDPFWGSKL